MKDDIDTEITRRQDELGKVFDEQDRKAEVEYQAALQKYDQCLQEYKKTYPSWSDSNNILAFFNGCGSQPFVYRYNIIGDTIFGNRYPARYLEDSYYRELTRIKETSFFQLFFEKLGFGWWGLIALLAVFLINILIALVKFLRTAVPIAIRAGSGYAALTKTNIKNMPAFQRYLLLIAALILATLIFILIKL